MDALSCRIQSSIESSRAHSVGPVALKRRYNLDAGSNMLLQADNPSKNVTALVAPSQLKRISGFGSLGSRSIDVKLCSRQTLIFDVFHPQS